MPIRLVGDDAEPLVLHEHIDGGFSIECAIEDEKRYRCVKQYVHFLVTEFNHIVATVNFKYIDIIIKCTRVRLDITSSIEDQLISYLLQNSLEDEEVTCIVTRPIMSKIAAIYWPKSYKSSRDFNTSTYNNNITLLNMAYTLCVHNNLMSLYTLSFEKQTPIKSYSFQTDCTDTISNTYRNLQRFDLTSVQLTDTNNTVYQLGRH